MGINHLIEISRRSFQVFNGAMNATSQNIANANTPGYSRRRVSLQADSLASSAIIMRMPPNRATGAGVSIQAYERVRDGLLASAAGSQSCTNAPQMSKPRNMLPWGSSRYSLPPAMAVSMWPARTASKA